MTAAVFDSIAEDKPERASYKARSFVFTDKIYSKIAIA